MKTRILILFFVTHWLIFPLNGQTSDKTNSQQKHDNPPLTTVQQTLTLDDVQIPKSSESNDISPVNGLNQKSIDTIDKKSGKKGLVSIHTQKASDSTKISKLEKLPFQVYSIKNTGWVIQQDIYNALRAKVPSLNISNTSNLNSRPVFRLRGNDAPVILLDGIRVDASILNTLNPEDIESIHVAPSAAGTNYFLNGYRSNWNQ
ncbi:MAG: TonB-dependent receptor plug domain-containing protein [Bacteroidota bacterium]